MMDDSPEALLINPNSEVEVKYGLKKDRHVV